MRMDDAKLAHCSSGFYTPQLSMVGRSDDTVKWRLPDLTPYASYPDWVYCARFPWSKNVVAKRDSPHQVLFGAMDPRYCLHANMGPWLEYHFELDLQKNELIFSYCGLDDPIRIKERVCGALNDVLRGAGFTVARVRVICFDVYHLRRLLTNCIPYGRAPYSLAPTIVMQIWLLQHWFHANYSF
jgi:hypothetical protein